MTEPDPSYHGAVWTEAVKPIGPVAYIIKARVTLLRDLGPAMSPFNAFQIIQGLETLPIRIEKHSENALALAQWLEGRDEVAWVNYPGLESSPYKELADKYLPRGQSGIVTFGIKGGFDAAVKFYDALKMIKRLVNIGDAKSLACHPASTTHRQLNEDELKTAGVSADLVRISVGIENIDDIIEDVSQALDQVTG